MVVVVVGLVVSVGLTPPPVGLGDRPGGIEKGSRSPTRSMGGEVGRGVSVGLGDTVGVIVWVGDGSAVSPPSPPPGSTNRNRYTAASAAITPRAMSIFLSRSVRAIAYAPLSVVVVVVVVSTAAAGAAAAPCVGPGWEPGPALESVV